MNPVTQFTARVFAAMLLALVLLAAGALMQGPDEVQAAQDVADEAAYAAAVADGGAAQCAASGRVPLWTPNGDLICRLPKRLTVLAQGSRP